MDLTKRNITEALSSQTSREDASTSATSDENQKPNLREALRRELGDLEYAEGYAESFLNSCIATQIKVLREERELTQPQLAALLGTKQSAISRVENVNYSAWSIRTLKRLARAFRVRLSVSFERYGTLPEEVIEFGREVFQRAPHEKDPDLVSCSEAVAAGPIAARAILSQDGVGLRASNPPNVLYGISKPEEPESGRVLAWTNEEPALRIPRYKNGGVNVGAVLITSIDNGREIRKYEKSQLQRMEEETDAARRSALR